MKKLIFQKSEGIITLFATLLGVFLALYLNEWNATRKLNRQKEIATENILMELKLNQKMLTESVKQHTAMLETFIFVNDHLDENENIITTTEKMNHFRSKYPNIITPKDSIKLEDGNYKYSNGEINFVFMLDQIELRTIAWESLKSSDLISVYSFDHIMNLEFIYKGINNISQRNQEIFDSYLGYMNNIRELQKMNTKLSIAIDIENTLIDLCNKGLEKLKVEN